jgi:ABC-type sugar transport system permease subunit
MLKGLCTAKKIQSFRFDRIRGGKVCGSKIFGLFLISFVVVGVIWKNLFSQSAHAISVAVFP